MNSMENNSEWYYSAEPFNQAPEVSYDYGYQYYDGSHSATPNYYHNPESYPQVGNSYFLENHQNQMEPIVSQTFTIPEANLQPVQTDHKKWKNSQKERRRTLNINGSFDRLRNMIPFLPSSRRVPKIKTLRLAINYINHLNNILQQQQQQDTTRSDSFSNVVKQEMRIKNSYKEQVEQWKQEQKKPHQQTQHQTDSSYSKNPKQQLEKESAGNEEIVSNYWEHW